MIIINNYSVTRFVFNGIQYLKNYVSRVSGNRIEIYNCYERHDVLLPLTPFASVMLNGVVYDTVAELQEAILGVIYLRNTLDDDGDTTQNNTGRRFVFGAIPGEGDITPEEAASWFNIQPWSVIVSAVATPILFEFYRISGEGTVKYPFLFLRGKGMWGAADGANAAGTVYASNFAPLTPHNLTVADISDSPGAVIIPLGETGEDYLAAANAEEHDFTLSGTLDDDGYYRAYYFSYVHDSLLYFVLFVGNPDIYGVDSDNFFTQSDFVNTTNSAVQPTPGLQQVTNQNAATTHPLTVVGNEIKLSHTSSGMQFVSQEGNVINIVHSNPLVVEVQYKIPAKLTDDTFAMLSDVRLDYGTIRKKGKGFVKSINGDILPNTGSFTEHEAGDIFHGIGLDGKEIAFMRYHGTGSVQDFNNFSWNTLFTAAIPGEPDYIAFEE